MLDRKESPQPKGEDFYGRVDGPGCAAEEEAQLKSIPCKMQQAKKSLSQVGGYRREARMGLGGRFEGRTNKKKREALFQGNRSLKRTCGKGRWRIQKKSETRQTPRAEKNWVMKAAPYNLFC